VPGPVPIPKCASKRKIEAQRISKAHPKYFNACRIPAQIPEDVLAWPRGEADCKSQARHCFLTRHAHTVQAEVQIVLCTLLSKNSMFGFHTQI